VLRGVIAACFDPEIRPRAAGQIFVRLDGTEVHQRWFVTRQASRSGIVAESDFSHGLLEFCNEQRRWADSGPSQWWLERLRFLEVCSPETAL
jgi:hypothetical protein